MHNDSCHLKDLGIPSIQEGKNLAVMPLVVGAIRSGTTLLRLMLDAHSQIAISPETSFPESLFRKAVELNGEALSELVVAHSKWSDLGLDRNEYLGLCKNLTGIESLKLVWKLYGKRQSKPIVGDKSPGYVKILPVIRSTFPDVRVIHIIRDGRDCFASQMHSRFSLFSKKIRTAAMQASEWQDAVEAGRKFGPWPSKYLEVRYEQLILNTPQVLKEICSFLGVNYEPAMLNYHVRAEERLQELGDRLVEGERLQEGELRRAAFSLTQRAPDDTRIGRWRETLLPEAVQEYEKVAGPLLSELGYETSSEILSSHDKLASQQWAEQAAAALALRNYDEAKRLATLSWRADSVCPERTARLLNLAEWTEDLAVQWRTEVVRHRAEHERFGNTPSAWNGEPLTDLQRLFVWKHYRHLGADIRYAAALSNLDSMKKNCSVEIDHRLIPLLKRRFPEIEFLPRGDSLTDDNIIPPGTAYNATWERLGYFLLPSAAAMPREPWLKVDSSLVEKFSSSRISGIPHPRVALVWQSINTDKSLPPLETWRHILSVQSVEFISAQHDSDPREIPAWEGLSHRIHTEPVDLRNDLDALAALMHSCDLLVTISATQAHLAGALGIPVWLIIREQPILSWPLGQQKSVWYPKTRFIWVRDESDWESTMQTLAEELRSWAQSRMLAT
jgi:hypothetical protein